MLSNYFPPNSLPPHLFGLLNDKIPVVGGGLRPLDRRLWSKDSTQEGPLALSHWISKANAILWFNMNGLVPTGL